MKQQLVDIARSVARALPISLTHKRKLQILCFRYFPIIFRHLPNYQLWILQNPSFSEKELKKLNLTNERQKILTDGHFKTQKPSILMISHSLGGGTEHHLKQLGEKLEAEGIRVWALRSLGTQWVQLLPYDSPEEGKGLLYHLESEFSLLTEQLKSLNIQLIHVHHLLDFHGDAKNMVQNLAKTLKVDYDFTAHDYLAICPRFTLYDEAVRGYCGEPNVKRCQGCVGSFGSAAGKDVNVKTWRHNYAEFLDKARHVYTPDEDVKQRLSLYLPKSTILNRPHWDETNITPVSHKPGKTLRILTLGGIAPHKGSMVLKECAEDAKKRGLDIEFTLIGFSDIDWLLKKYMTVTGPYKPKELPDMIQEGKFDAIFLPAVWPETFNYTLSEALNFGLYPISFDIGAIGRRIAKLGYGSVLPYDIYRDASAINDAILTLNIPSEIPIEKIKKQQHHYKNFIRDYYNLDIKAST